MKITSPAFEHGEKIPKKYTCDGENINPELRIEMVPTNAKSLALIMDDPDVPRHIRSDGLWVHWVVFNMPVTTKVITEGEEPEGVGGAGTNKEVGYRGPCPPDREHRYFFKLYALDILLDLPEGATKDQLEKIMKDHIIEEAQLAGRYSRK